MAHSFLGSGSTAVAALRHGRRFLGIDLSRRCIDESARRLRQEGLG